jgi:hypothetical protein
VIRPTTGLGLNPGFINPTPFYNTTSPTQSKFNWGAKGYQVGPTFDPVAYNQAPGSDQPWGLQQLGRSLTTEQISDIIAGRPVRSVSGPVPAQATRTQAYNPASMITPSATNVYQLPVAPTSTFSTGTSQAQANQALRDQLAYDQQLALSSGNNDLYWQIQAKLDALDQATTTNVVK